MPFVSIEGIEGVGGLSTVEDSTSSLIVLDVTFDFSSSMSMEEGSILDAVF